MLAQRGSSSKRLNGSNLLSVRWMQHSYFDRETTRTEMKVTLLSMHSCHRCSSPAARSQRERRTAPIHISPSTLTPACQDTQTATKCNNDNLFTVFSTADNNVQVLKRKNELLRNKLDQLTLALDIQLQKQL
jgi:hypothetical protein